MRATAHLWEMTTPLGVPVEPDVYIRYAPSSDLSGRASSSGLWSGQEAMSWASISSRHTTRVPAAEKRKLGGQVPVGNNDKGVTSIGEHEVETVGRVGGVEREVG